MLVDSDLIYYKYNYKYPLLLILHINKQTMSPHSPQVLLMSCSPGWSKGARRHRTKHAPSTAAGRPVRWPAVKCIRGHERSHSYIDADASAIVEENYYECTKKIDNCKDTGCPKKGQKHQVSIFSYNFFKNWNCRLTSNDEVKIWKSVCLF